MFDHADAIQICAANKGAKFWRLVDKLTKIGVPPSQARATARLAKKNLYNRDGEMLELPELPLPEEAVA